MPQTITPVPVTEGIGTPIAAIKDSSNNVYQAITQYAQVTQLFTLQNQAVADGAGTTITTDGLNGLLGLKISNGNGTCTVWVQGSDDPDFTISQDTATVGVVPTCDSGNGTITFRPIQSGLIDVAVNTTYRFILADLYPYMRAAIIDSSGLGQGSEVLGCTVTVYGVPN